MENEHELSYESLTKVYLGSYEDYKSVGAEVEPLEPRIAAIKGYRGGSGGGERLWDELYSLETSMEDVEGCLWCRGLYGAKGKDVANFRTKKWIVVFVRSLKEKWVHVLDMQVMLHDKRIVMQVTLHYEAIVMQVTLHDKRIVM
nr:hypothetical protein [Tanacetum cinerariifolium]